MSENTPPMIAPLINLLTYNGITPFGDQLLLDTTQDQPSLHDHNKSFLKQLISIKGRIPPPSTPITKQEDTEEVNRLRESTSLGPSTTTPDMVKMEALDPEIREIERLRFNLPWCTMYLPERYLHVLDLLIKEYSEYHITHRLRPIPLFDIEANMHNKNLGRQSMKNS